MKGPTTRAFAALAFAGLCVCAVGLVLAGTSWAGSDDEPDALARGQRALCRGELAQALVEAGRAAADAPASDRQAQSEALLLRARALFEAGDSAESTLALEAARGLLLGTPHAATLVKVLTLEGELAHRNGDFASADGIMREAIAWAESLRLDDPEPWLAHGRLLALHGQHEEALLTFERTTSACRVGERRLERSIANEPTACLARVDVLRAAIHEGRGEPHRARTLLEPALGLLTAEHWALERVQALTTLARAALTLGEAELAGRRADEAVALARRLGVPALKAKALEVRAEAHLAKEEHEDAQALLEEARTAWMKVGAPGGIAASRLVSARVALARRAFPEAAIHLRAAGEAAEHSGNEGALTEVLVLEAELARLTGRGEDERAALAAAIARGPAPQRLAQLEARSARLAQEDGALEAAIDHLEGATRAAERIPTLRLAPSLREHAMTQRHALYDRLVSSLVARGDRAPEQREKDWRLAILASERSAARAVSDMLERSRVLRETPDARTAMAALAALDERQREILTRDPPGGASFGASQLDALGRERQALEARVLGLAPSAMSERRPERLENALATLEARLAPEVVLAKYHLGEDGSHLFLWSHDGLSHHALPPRAELVSRIGRYTDAIATPPGARTSAQRRALITDGEALADLLLAPVLAATTPRRPGANGAEVLPRIVLVPHRELRALPFDALPVAVRMGRGGGRTWLLERAVVSTAPSLAALVTLEAERQEKQAHVRHPLLAFADALYSSDRGDLPRLEATAEEARSASAYLQGADPSHLAGSVFLEADANEAKLKRIALSRYRYVHFATHGFAPGGLPSEALRSREDEAVLYLGREGDEDGRITVDEVLDLSLDADLVVLSACSSGRAPTEPGDGLGGLVNAFLHAGSAAVISTLWPIEDRHAAETMKELYRGLAGHADPARALNAARRALLAGGGVRRGGERAAFDGAEPPAAWVMRGMGGVTDGNRGRDRGRGKAPLDPFFWGAWTLTGATGDALTAPR